MIICEYKLSSDLIDISYLVDRTRSDYTKALAVNGMIITAVFIQYFILRS